MAKPEGNPEERISDAEHAVMEALWRESPRTAADISDEIGDERGWSLATVKTLLGRLVSKQSTACSAAAPRRCCSTWSRPKR